MLLFIHKSYTSTHRQNERVLLSFKNIKALTFKMCFNSCDQKQLLHQKETPIIVIEKLQNHRINTLDLKVMKISIHKTSSKRKWWTPGPHQHPASASWYELRTSTTSSTAIWIRIRHSTTVSFVKAIEYYSKPVGHFILFFSELRICRTLLHCMNVTRRDQWHSLTISYVVHSHIFS